MERVFLLLGSNQGKREEFLRSAQLRLSEKIGPIRVSSSYFETAPWGDTNQADFINQVLQFEVNLSPEELLETILDIEIELGRVRNSSFRYGSRSIDIDILYFGAVIMETEKLAIPHPRIGERRFALEPLVEIAADLIHPKTKLTQQEMLDRCEDLLPVKKIKGNPV